ncbi:EamA family transporter [Algicella marina]|uniref:EamA family transporter n=1 Tax=Algicella marina TaxID=2683284 RepID=A0A6P1SYR6_9RHOB|nr:EamA family transporter [Algicella marina]QHQ35618.1 EamA family transporter [Algicella marina]
MTLANFAIVLFSVTISALAQTTLKFGVSRVILAPDAGILEKVITFFFSPFVLLGFCLYGIGAIVWLFALRNLDVSLAYPFVSMAFIMVIFSGVFFLGEALTMPKMIGTALIVAGLITLGRA